MAKYKDIRSELEQRIAAGTYEPGCKLPTEAALCNEFSAARTTVGKALADLQKAGLIHRRQGAGTFVLQDGQNNPLKQIGLLIPGIGEGEIFEPICSAIAANASEFGLRIHWKQLAAAGSENKAPAVMRLCRQYLNEGIDGLFFQPLELENEKDDINNQIVALLRGEGIHLVLIDADFVYPERSGFDLVGIDNFRVGSLLAHHLAKRGCRRPIFLHRPNSASTIRARAAGFLSVLVERGLPCENAILQVEPNAPGLATRVADKLKADGIACGNDYTAARLMKTLVNAGITIPDKILLAGVDDVKYAQLLPVPLTTLAQPCSDIGLAAIELMRFRIDHPDATPRQILLDTHLIERESTR